jgi:hypothetical protein
MVSLSNHSGLCPPQVLRRAQDDPMPLKKAMSKLIAFFNLSDFPTTDFRLISSSLPVLPVMILMFAGTRHLLRHQPHGDRSLG